MYLPRTRFSSWGDRISTCGLVRCQITAHRVCRRQTVNSLLSIFKQMLLLFPIPKTQHPESVLKTVDYVVYRLWTAFIIGATGFEPVTFCSQSRRPPLKLCRSYGRHTNYLGGLSLYQAERFLVRQRFSGGPRPVYLSKRTSINSILG